MRGLLLVILILLPLTAFADGDVVEKDDFTLSTEVKGTSPVMFTTAKDVSGVYGELTGDLSLTIDDATGTGSASLGVELKTNLKEAVDLKLTGTALTRLDDNDALTDETVTLKASSDGSLSADFPSAAIDAGIPDGSSGFILFEESDTHESGQRTIWYPIELTAEMGQATAGKYKAFLRIEVVGNL